MTICGANLIPIFITILFCGFIFIYFTTRLAEVKNAVEKQNRVLTAFITNVQNDIRSGNMVLGMSGGANGMGLGAGANGMGANDMDYSAMGANANGMGMGANHLASEEALRAVNLPGMIVVSDDDSDNESNTSSDSESDSDSDSDSVSDYETELYTTVLPSINDEELKIITLQEPVNQSDIVNLELVPDNLDIEHLSNMLESTLLGSTLLVDVSSVSINNESNIANDSSLKVVDLNGTLDAEADATKSNIHYEQLKVDDLRKIVADFGLASKDEVKKLKKPELLVLLKK